MVHKVILLALMGTINLGLLIAAAMVGGYALLQYLCMEQELQCRSDGFCQNAFGVVVGWY